MAGRDKKWEHLYGMTFAVAMGTAEQRKEALLSGADVTIIGRDNVSWMTKIYFLILTWSSLMSCRASSPRRHRGSKT